MKRYLISALLLGAITARTDELLCWLDPFTGAKRAAWQQAGQYAGGDMVWHNEGMTVPDHPPVMSKEVQEQLLHDPFWKPPAHPTIYLRPPAQKPTTNALQ